MNYAGELERLTTYVEGDLHWNSFILNNFHRIGRRRASQRQYGQDQYIDYRAEHTGITVKKGPTPDLVVNVLVGWPDGPEVADEYTYVDSASSPSMLATNKRIIRYRLVAYSDMTMQDQVEGLVGRPLGGMLGAMFKVIGPGRVVWSRFAVSEDGLLVTHSRAKKGIAKN